MDEFRSELKKYVDQTVALKRLNDSLNEELTELKSSCRNVQEQCTTELEIAKECWHRQAIEYGIKQRLLGREEGEMSSAAASSKVHTAELNMRCNANMNATATRDDAIVCNALIASGHFTVALFDFDTSDHHVALVNTTDVNINLKGCYLLLTCNAMRGERFEIKDEVILGPRRKLSIWWDRDFHHHHYHNVRHHCPTQGLQLGATEREEANRDVDTDSSLSGASDHDDHLGSELSGDIALHWNITASTTGTALASVRCDNVSQSPLPTTDRGTQSIMYDRVELYDSNDRRICHVLSNQAMFCKYFNYPMIMVRDGDEDSGNYSSDVSGGGGDGGQKLPQKSGSKGRNGGAVVPKPDSARYLHTHWTRLNTHQRALFVEQGEAVLLDYESDIVSRFHRYSKRNMGNLRICDKIRGQNSSDSVEDSSLAGDTASRSMYDLSFGNWKPHVINIDSLLLNSCITLRNDGSLEVASKPDSFPAATSPKRSRKSSSKSLSPQRSNRGRENAPPTKGEEDLSIELNSHCTIQLIFNNNVAKSGEAQSSSPLNSAAGQLENITVPLGQHIHLPAGDTAVLINDPAAEATRAAAGDRNTHHHKHYSVQSDTVIYPTYGLHRVFEVLGTLSDALAHNVSLDRKQKRGSDDAEYSDSDCDSDWGTGCADGKSKEAEIEDDSEKRSSAKKSGGRKITAAMRSIVASSSSSSENAQYDDIPICYCGIVDQRDRILYCALVVKRVLVTSTTFKYIPASVYNYRSGVEREHSTLMNGNDSNNSAKVATKSDLDGDGQQRKKRKVASSAGDSAAVDVDKSSSNCTIQ